MSTVSISIHLDLAAGNADEQLAQALGALGYEKRVRRVEVQWKQVDGPPEGNLPPRGDSDSGPTEVNAAPTPEELTVVDPPVEEKPKRGRKPKAAPVEEKPLISTGGPRVSPEDAEQDAADEEAEAEEAPAKELTHDDVRSALMDYANKYGIPAAQADGPKVLSLRFGEAVTKVSQVPLVQSDLAQAIKDIREMLEKNPFNRSVPL